MLTSSPVQTEYNRYQPIAQNGMLASSVNFSADTRIVEIVSGGLTSIPFGRAVSQGVNDQGCVVGGDAFVGITRLDQTIARSDTLPIDEYPEGDNAAILVTGDLWVICWGDVTVGDSVHYDDEGKLSASGGTAIDSSRWQTSAASGELAVVRLGNIAGQA